MFSTCALRTLGRPEKNGLSLPQTRGFSISTPLEVTVEGALRVLRLYDLNPAPWKQCSLSHNRNGDSQAERCELVVFPTVRLHKTGYSLSNWYKFSWRLCLTRDLAELLAIRLLIVRLLRETGRL